MLSHFKPDDPNTILIIPDTEEERVKLKALIERQSIFLELIHKHGDKKDQSDLNASEEAQQ